MNVPINKPNLAGKERYYIAECVKNGHLSGNDPFTQKCQMFLESHYGFRKCLLTTFCTDAFEMCTFLLNIQPINEVIFPSYAFVSIALQFIRQRVKTIFVDSRPVIPKYSSNNGYIFYLLFSSLDIRSFFIKKMKEQRCSYMFYYLSHYKSKYYRRLKIQTAVWIPLFGCLFLMIYRKSGLIT